MSFLVRTHQLQTAIARLIFLFTLVWVFVLLFDYNIVWAQPESLVWRHILLTANPNLNLDALKQFLNYSIFEGRPRITRPLSEIMEILDLYFRVWFHEKFFPHPSISLTWIFTIILSPIVLYKSLRLMNFTLTQTWLGLSLYISCHGVLSLLTMSFRSGKSLACFFYIVIFYLSLKLIKEGGQPLILALIFFISLFTDEIALFGFFVIASVFNWDIKKYWKEFIGLLLILAIYFLTIKSILPLVHSAAGFPVLGGYDKESEFYNLIFLLPYMIRKIYLYFYYISQ